MPHTWGGVLFRVRHGKHGEADSPARTADSSVAKNDPGEQIEPVSRRQDDEAI